MKTLLVALFLCQVNLAQAMDVTGRVIDGYGKSLGGVRISIDGMALETTTDESGEYVIPVSSGRRVAGETISVAKEGYDRWSRQIIDEDDLQNFTLVKEGTVVYTASTGDENGAWQIARTTYHIEDQTTELEYLTSEEWNFKSNWCPDGSKVTFFRRYENPSNDVASWKTAIAVMNADGSGYREITEHAVMNTEPYWTRDGSMRVTFNRMAGDVGPYWQSFDGEPGGEERITASGGWVNPSLKDGRFFYQGGQDSNNSAWVNTKTSWLVSGNDSPGGQKYEKISYPGEPHYLHKISISEDETRIVYQKHVDTNYNPRRGGVMVIADFDASIPAITNERIVDALDPDTMAWYISISRDNSHVLFAKDGDIIMHHVESGVKTVVSTPGINHAYPAFVTYMK